MREASEWRVSSLGVWVVVVVVVVVVVDVLLTVCSQTLAGTPADGASPHFLISLSSSFSLSLSPLRSPSSLRAAKNGAGSWGKGKRRRQVPAEARMAVGVRRRGRRRTFGQQIGPLRKDAVSGLYGTYKMSWMAKKAKEV